MNAGLKQIRIHGFKHFCASLIVNNKTKITVTAKHNKIEGILNAYTRIFNSAVNEVIYLIDKLEKNIGLIQCSL